MRGRREFMEEILPADVTRKVYSTVTSEERRG
jgi:hypothetical protein